MRMYFPKRELFEFLTAADEIKRARGKVNLLFALPKASKSGEDFMSLSSNELTAPPSEIPTEFVFPRLTMWLRTILAASVFPEPDSPLMTTD
jgi:hypothetical protein